MPKKDLNKIKIFFTVLFSISIFISLCALDDLRTETFVPIWRHALLWADLIIHDGLMLLLVLGIKSIETNKE